MTTQSTPMIMHDKPLMVYKELAVMLGINQALILQQLRYLMDSQEEVENEYVFIDGRWWVYHSYAQWKTKHFPWLSDGTIKNAFLKMEQDGYVLTMQSVKHKSDRRKWYTIDFEAWSAFQSKHTHEIKIVPSTSDKNCPIIGQKLDDGYKETTIQEKKKTPGVAGEGDSSDSQYVKCVTCKHLNPNGAVCKLTMYLDANCDKHELPESQCDKCGGDLDYYFPGSMDEVANPTDKQSSSVRNYCNGCMSFVGESARAQADGNMCPDCHELYIEVRSVDGAKHLTCLCDDSTMQKNDNAPLDGRKVGRKPHIDPAITAAIPPQNIKRTPRMVLPSEEEINALGESTANIKAKTVEVAQIVSPPAPETAQEKRDKEIDAIEADMKRVGNPQETFGAICGVLGWDTDTVPKKKKSRVGKAARELMEVNASIWKLERMQRWAKSKYGDKWNFGFNLGSPEKVVEFWATYCGETKSENVILTPADPNIPLHFVEPSPLPPEERVSPEEIAKTMAAMVQLTRRKSTSYDPLTDTTAEEREAQNE